MGPLGPGPEPDFYILMRFCVKHLHFCENTWPQGAQEPSPGPWAPWAQGPMGPWARARARALGPPVAMYCPKKRRFRSTDIDFSILFSLKFMFIVFL